METDLIFRRVGNYSMKQAKHIIGEEQPEDNCCVCKNVKYGDVLVRITPIGEEEKYICCGCLLHHYDSTIRLWATDKPDKIPQSIKHLFFEIKESQIRDQ